MDEPVLEALTALERREVRLLAWGAVGAEWERPEILAVLAEYGPPGELLKELVDAALVVRTPRGGYRTRSAETVRLIATLRQAFRGQRVGDGKPLVLDYRFLHRTRRRPRRDVPVSEILAGLRARLGPAGLATAQRLLPPELSGFQQRSTRAVLDALGASAAGTEQPAGVMVTAGTGSGKTLAFYLPMLAWLTDRAGGSRQGPTLGLALYPRNELLKDQLRALLGYVTRITATEPTAPVPSLATWFGPTPVNANAVRRGWAQGWVRRGPGFVCPYLRCLRCDSELLWLESDLAAGREVERLVCAARSCVVVDGSHLRLTRDSARRRPADLMLSTTESLNRQLSAPGNLGAFGIQPASLAAVLLDEVHTYEGTAGAQNAVLLRRLRHALGRTPVWVGLSATLRNSGEFFARLVGLPVSAVAVVEPTADEMEDSGAEYLLAVRSDPHSKAGTLSTSIQTCMVLARSLDSGRPDPFDPPPSSEGVFGTRIFAFTDKLDTTNRLFWNLLDAEGWSWPGRPADFKRPLTLAHLRAEQQSRVKADCQEDAAARNSDGQWWWLSELLGHGVEADRQLRVDRVSSQDRGVAGDADVVVATATLEVGFDDERVGAVVQHKAPHDAAQFLQRKGRAGRNMTMRPWTVVVLSDWGRDRQAWEAYDALFDPDLPPRSLPIENLYVLRIQAVYALMDWLAAELGYSGRESTWVDLAGPASGLHPDNQAQQAQTQQRQQRMSDLLTRLLRPGPERERMRRHLRNALGLGSGDTSESIVDSVLWDSPRPLLLAVVPTMRRRLTEQWRGEEPAADDLSLRTRTPLRSFVPGNLFDDLLVPDVELLVPGRPGQVDVEHLPALRALREFAPGNVSRHFGVWAANKRHWVPLPPRPQDGSPTRVDLETTYGANTPAGTVEVDGMPVEVYPPRAAMLAAVPDPVKDYSSVQLDWEFHAAELGAGTEVRLGRAAGQLLTTLTAHMHVQGGGARIMRFARTASGAVWDPTGRPVQLRYGVGGGDLWRPAAVGVDVHCDAMAGVARTPEPVAAPTPAERTSRLRHRLVVEADLPVELSSFDRESLSGAVLLAVTQTRLDGIEPADPGDWAEALLNAVVTLGITTDVNDHRPPESRLRWERWCRDPDVLSAVSAAVAEVSADERSAAWLSWWRRRYTSSVAHLVVTALAMLCPGVDVNELMVDLAPDEQDRFWVSEPSPGGVGQVEAFLRILAQEPEAFSRALEVALTPTAVDTMDDELVQLLRSESPPVRAAMEELREAWAGGHAAVVEAVRRVDQAARATGLSLGGPARSALSTRLAGPGAHPRLLDEVVSWLDLRDAVAEIARLGVDARTLGALLAQEEHVDEVLHLDAAATTTRRARAVANVLWPWAESAFPANLFGPHLELSFAAIRAHVELGPLAFDVVPWSDERRDELHNVLREHGEVVLRAGHSDRAVLRTAVVDLQVRPIEVGALLCHPVVVGQHTSARFVQNRVLLREAL